VDSLAADILNRQRRKGGGKNGESGRKPVPEKRKKHKEKKEEQRPSLTIACLASCECHPSAGPENKREGGLIIGIGMKGHIAGIQEENARGTGGRL